MANVSFLRAPVTVTPTLDTNAYAPGDVLFNPTLVTRASAAADVPTYLVGLDVFDQDDQTAYDIRIILMASNTNLGTLNSAPNISDANGLNILADILIPAASWHDIGGFKFCHATKADLPIPVVPVEGTPNIYVAGMIGASGTPTHTASGLKVRLWFQDIFPY